MLIQSKGRNKISIGKILSGLILTVFLFLFIKYLAYPFYLQQSTIENSELIFCDAEIVSGNEFISNGKSFSAGQTQSTDFAHSGKHSSKLEKGEGAQYGFAFNLEGIEPGDIYKSSVWVKKKKSTTAFLVFEGEKDAGLYQAANEPGKVENSFEKLSMVTMIPKYYKKGTAKIYVYTDGKDVAYFDDLQIQKLDSLPSDTSDYAFDPLHLELKLKDKAFKKLKAKRDAALDAGVLISDEDSWVKGQLIEEQKKIPVELRLKGDWLDHIKSKKWSFRVKTKSGNTWNRMVTFSLHTPKARYYALEWLLHQFWEREDVLTTRYDFITLSFNGEHLGSYAYEEHFEKQLLEFRNRREGPIVRFSEEALWDARSRQFQTGIGNSVHPEEAKISSAQINPFKASKTKKSETLSKQYEIAQNLLFQYQQGTKLAEEIFDMDQMAKYNAILDLFGAHHGLVWHNQRFYYNPVTSLLEPIGFDGFGLRPRRDPLVLGKALLENAPSYNHGPLIQLYSNEIFIEKYMHYLDKYTSSDFLNTFFNETRSGMDARVDFLKLEFPDFKYHPSRIQFRAQQIRYKLLPFHEHSIKANWVVSSSGQTVLQINNSHELPLKVKGTGASSKDLDNIFENPIHMPAFRLGNPTIPREVVAPENAQFIFYQPYGIDTLFSSKISLWKKPEDYVPKQALFSNIQLTSNSIYDVVDKRIIFKKGQHQSNQDIIIPKGYEIIFQAGCRLDITGKAKFISQSPVFMNGSSEEPVVVYSSDQSVNGFTILQSDITSQLYFTTFKDFNTLNYQGWTITGAVSFYESDVEIKNVKIIDNHCEDALNIIRSDFSISELELINPNFDGFDADFCTGIITNSIIQSPGNDGLDFSGSQIDIIQCEIYNAQDKGISVGEESKVTVDQTLIDGAVIGVASKDLSYLKVKSLTLKNCNQGFAAYQKKPEYGRSTIFVDDYSADNVKYLHTIAPRCTLELKGQVIVGEALGADN